MNRYTYDPQNFRLLRTKAEKYTFSETTSERTYAYNSGTNRQDLAYEYDLNGNILKKKNRTPDCGINGSTLGVDALDNQYAYNAISRLLSASGRESDANNESHRWADAPVAGSPNANNTQTYTRSYTYDKVGNIQSLQQTGSNAFTREFEYTVNTLDDITVSGTSTSFNYDANGNLVSSGSSRYYEWNEKDQLTFFKIDAGGGPSVYAHYLYDSGGNRVKKIVWDQQGNKEVTVYIDGIFEYRLKQEDSTDKEQNIIHVMDDSARIAQVRIGTEFNDDIAEEVNYVLDDHIGSSTTRLGATGSVIDRQEFYPFGDTSLRTYSKKRYQFIGREKDAESGLHYWSARYYSSWMCRFISVDKMASSYAHLTPYNYADNDPINDFDIDGNQNNNTQQTPSGGLPTLEQKGETNTKITNLEVHGNTKPELIPIASAEGGIKKHSLSKEPVGPISESTANKEKVYMVTHNFPTKKLPLINDTLKSIKTDDANIVEQKKETTNSSEQEWHPPLAATQSENIEEVVDYSFDKFISQIAGNYARNTSFNVDLAVKTLDTNAKSASVHRCARFVRLAINAGGIKTPNNSLKHH